MKSKIYFIAILALLSLQHTAQWSRIDSITHGNINTIHFTNADTGFVYTQPGVMWRTANGGQSWDSIALNFTGYIHDIAFASPDVGYAVGGAWFPHGVHYPYAIYKTKDGGLSWDSIHVGGSGGVFNYVATLSTNEFFATSTEGMIHSADGGQTYDTVSVNNTPWGTEQYTRIRFLNATEGYVLGRSNLFTGHLFRLYKTTNGGQSWQSIHADTTLNFSLDFVITPQGQGVIVGNDNFVLRTINGGSDWDTVTLPRNSIMFRQVEQIDGYWYARGSDAADTSHCIYSSSDGGITWQKQFSRKANTGGFIDMSIAGPNVGYCTDWRNVYKNSKLISLPEMPSADFQLYPNPASNTVSLELVNSSPVKVSIHNSFGQRVREFYGDGESVVSLDVSMLRAGLYILTVHQSGVSINRKFLKE